MITQRPGSRTAQANPTGIRSWTAVRRTLTTMVTLLIAGGFGVHAGWVNAAPPAAPSAAPDALPHRAPAMREAELTTLRLYGDTVVCDSCIEGQSNRPASAGADDVTDPNTGLVPEDAPYTDPRGPFSPLSDQAPRHDYVTWNPAFISERLNEGTDDWACLTGPDEVSAASNIRASGVNAAQKVWLRHWYEPSRLDKDLNADDCLTDADGDGMADAAVNPTPSNRDEWYPAVMTELTYLLVENDLPQVDVSGDAVADSAPRPMCGAMGATRMVLPVGTFDEATDPLGPAEGQGLTSLDYDFDDRIDMVNVTSESELAADLGVDVDFDGDGTLDDLDPNGVPLDCDEMMVFHSDAMTIGTDEQLQMLDHFVRLRAASGGSATLEIWYNGSLLPRRIDTRSIGVGGLALAGDVGPVTVLPPGGGNLGTVPRGPWFVYVDGVDANDNTATLIVGRALGAPCASMEAAPNTTNLSPGGPWFLKRFYVDGHEYNVTAIMSCDTDEIQYFTLRAPLPKVPVTIEQHSVRLQPYAALDPLVLPPPYNYEHTVLEDVVVVPSDQIGPCPVGGVDPNPLDPEPRPEIRYAGGPIGPIPPVLSGADGNSYTGRNPDEPVGPYDTFEDWLASHWFYVDEDVNPQMLGQLREKHGTSAVTPASPGTPAAGAFEGFFYNEQIWTRPWNYTEFFMPDQSIDQGCDPDAYYVTSGFIDETARWRRWSMPDGDVPDQIPPPPPDLVEDHTAYDPGTGQYGAPRRASFVHDPDRMDITYTGDEGVRVHGGWPACPDGDCSAGAAARPDVQFGAGDPTALDPAGYPVEVPPYTDPFAPFNPQAPDAPRGDSLTFDPAYMDEFRNFGEPLRLLYQQLSNMAMNAREKVYHRLWYQPEYVTKIRTADDCDRDLAFPAVMQEFTYLMMDTTDNPVAVPVPGSRLGFPLATRTDELPRPNSDGTLPAGGEFGYGLTTFDVDFDGFPEAASLHSEQSLNQQLDATFQANRPSLPPGIPQLPLLGPVVDFDGDAITDTLDADCSPLNGNEMVVLAVESVALDAEDDTPTGHAAMVLDHMVSVENITGGFNPSVQVRFFFTGGSIADARPEQVGGVETLSVGSLAVVDRFQDSVEVIEPGETNLGQTDGAWFVFVEDVSESGERAVFTVGRALGATHSAIDDGFGNHDLAAGDPWYLKRFYVDGHEYNVTAVGTASAPGSDPLDPDSCNDHFTFLSIRTPVPKGNFFNPQDSLFQQGYFIDELPDVMSVMPPFNVRHTVARDIERMEPADFANVNRFDQCVGPLAAAAPLEERIVAETEELRFSNALRETYRPMEEPFELDGWETHQTALTPGHYTQIDVPEGSNYLLTLAWESRVSRLSFYGCTRADPGPFDDEEFPPALGHSEVAEAGATWDPALIPDVNRLDPPSMDDDANGIQDIVPFFDARCSITETVRVKLFYDPAEDDDLYVNKRLVEVDFEEADLSIEKTADDDTPAAGDLLIYTIDVTNLGPDDVDPVLVDDQLPEGVTYISDSDNCVPSGMDPELLNCDLGPLSAGASESFQILVRLDPDLATGTALINVASVGSPGVFDPDPSNNEDDHTATTTKESDIRLDKTASDSTPVAGRSFVYTLRVSNDGPSDATGVTVQDTMPAGLTAVSTTRPDICDILGGVEVVCTVGDLPVGDDVEIDVFVDVDPSVRQGTRLTNDGRASSGEPDPNPNNNEDRADVIVTNENDLSISKQANPDPVVAGERLTYTPTVENAGPSDAYDVVISDTLPAATMFVSSSGAACSGVPVGGTGTLTCDVGTVPVGDQAVVTIVVDVDPSIGDGSSVENRASVTNPGDDPDPDNNDTSTPVTVLRRADLTVSLSAPAEVFPGRRFDWTVTVDNLGPSDAEDVEVESELPPQATLVSVSGASCTGVPIGGTGTLTCDVGDLAAGDSAVYQIRLRVAGAAADGDVLTHTATVSSATVDPNASNDQAVDTVTVRRRADVSIRKTVLGDAVAGDMLTYAFNVNNSGPTAATAVVVTDTLPSGMTFVSSTGGCVESPPASGEISCSLGDLPAGASASFNVTVMLDASLPEGTELTNGAVVTSDTTDPDPDDNEDDVPVTVERRSDLVISKADAPDPVVAGTTLRYTITVQNDGPSDAADVTVVDMLPDETTYVSSTTGCVEGPSGTLTCDLGSLAVGGSTTFTIDVLVGAATQDGTVILNQAEVDSASDEVDPGDNSDTESTTVITSADVSVTKTALEPNPVAGETFDYEIEVANAGPSVASNVTVVDVLPAELSYVSDTDSCAEAPAGTLTCSLGDIAPGGVETYMVTVRVDAATPDGTDVTNTATVNSDADDPDDGDNDDDETVTTTTQADLAVQLTGPATVDPSEQIVYTISVDNLGPSDAVGASVVITLPAGTTYASSSITCVAGGGNTRVCSVGALGAGGSTSFNLTADVDDGLSDGAVLTAEAEVSASTPDPDLSNNTDTHQTTITRLNEADLAITKEALNSAPGVGETYSYRITVQNNGPRTATGVTVTDTLPSGVSFVVASESCTEGPTGTIVCMLADLPSGGSASFTITVEVDTGTPAGATLTNTAVVGSDLDDPDPSNNEDEVDVTLQPRTDMVISIIDSVDPVAAGAALSYLIDVSNDGPSAATGAVVTITLPSGVAYVGDDAGCDDSAPPVLVCSLGGIPSGGSATIDVDVTVDADLPGGTVLMAEAEVSANEPDPDGTNNSDDETTTVERSTDRSVVKSASHDERAPGQRITYTLTVANAGPSDATGVVVTDTLPTGVTYVSDDVGCDASAEPTIVCQIGLLAAGDSTVIQIVAEVNLDTPAETVLTNSAVVGGDDPDPDPGNDDSTTDTAVTPLADLRIAKSGAGEVVIDGSPPMQTVLMDAVTAGRRLTYTLAVFNDGPTDATDVTITDQLPVGVSYVSDDSGCNATAEPTIVCSIGALADGASATVTIVVEVDPSVAPGSDLTNLAAVDGGEADPDESNNTTTQVTQVDAASDLAMTKTSNAPTVAVGERVTFTLTVANLGPSDASGVVITDTLPSGLTYVSNDGACNDGGAPTIVCTIGSITAGSSVQIRIVAEVDPGTEDQTLTNTAVVDADDDPDPSNNEDDADVTPSDEADLSVVKSGVGTVVGSGDPPSRTITPDMVTAGERITWTIEVSNDGPATATGVVVTDTIPSGVTVLSTDPACGGSPPQITCALPDIPAGASTTLTIVGRVSADVPDGTQLENAVVVDTDRLDPDPTDNSDKHTTVVRSSSDLTVIKQATPSVVDVGELVTFTLTVANAGPSTAAAVTLTDTLPAGLAYVSDDSGCDATGAPTIVCDLGDLAPGALTTVELVAEALPAAAGTIQTNVAVVRQGEGEDPNPADNEDDEDVSVPPRVDLRLDKAGIGEVVAPGNPPSVTLIPNLVTAGRQLTYTLTVANSGPSTATGVTITDTLPGGVALVDIVGASCNTGSFPTITCTLADVPAGDSAQVTIVVQVDPSVTPGSTLLNSAVVGSDEDEATPADNSAEQETDVDGAADLAVDKTVMPSTVAAGDLVTFTLSVVNLGPSRAVDVVLTDTLPSGVSYVSDDAACDATGEPEIVCGLGSLDPGDGSVVTLVAQVDQALGEQILVNTVVVGSETDDPNLNNNEDDEPFGVEIPVDLVVEKSGAGTVWQPGTPPTVSVEPGRVAAGGTVTWTIEIRNDGVSTATNVVLTDTLPADTSYVSDDRGCDATADPEIVCGLGSIAPGGTATVTIVASVDAGVPGGTVLTNTARADADQPETQNANNEAEGSVTVEEQSDLEIIKTGEPQFVTGGDRVTWTLRVENLGPSVARDVRVTDTLPAGLSYASNTDSCIEDPPGSGTLGCALGDLLPGQSSTFTITANVDQGTPEGTLTNGALVSLPDPGSDPNPGNDEDEASVEVVDPANTADLRIKKSVAEALPDNAKIITFTIDVLNMGPLAATNVRVTDTLSSSIDGEPASVASITNSTYPCNIVTGELMTCDLGNMASGSAVTFDVTVSLESLPQQGVVEIRNTARTTSDTPDLFLENNEGTAAVQLVGGSFLVASQTNSDGSVTLSWSDTVATETVFVVEVQGDGTPFMPMAVIPSQSGVETGRTYEWRSPPMPAGRTFGFRVVADDPGGGRMAPRPSVGVFATAPERAAKDVGCFVGQLTLAGRSGHAGAWIRIDGFPAAQTDSRGMFRLCGASPGVHAMSTWKPGYLTAAALASIAAGGTTELPWVSVPGGDLNGDHLVGLVDLVRVAAALDLPIGEAGGDPAADLNGDARIDELDLSLVGASYGRRGPLPWWKDARVPGVVGDDVGSTSDGRSVTGVGTADASRPPTRSAMTLWAVDEAIAAHAMDASRESDSRAVLDAESGPVDVILGTRALDGGGREVRVVARGVRDVYGVDLVLSFDRDRARMVDAERDAPGSQATLGDDWRRVGRSFEARNEVTSEGLWVVATRMRPAAAMSGDLVLAELTLEPLQEGDSLDGAFRLAEARLLTRRGADVPVTVTGVEARSPIDWSSLSNRLYLPRVVR